FNGYHPLSASTYYFVGYTYFLAVLYALFGHDLAAARVIQGVVGTATVGLVYLVGSLAFGRRAGLTSALMTAIYLAMVYSAVLTLPETLFTCLQMSALALWLRAWAAGPDSVAPEAGPDGGPGPAADHSRTRTVPGLALALAAGLTAGMACL